MSITSKLRLAIVGGGPDAFIGPVHVMAAQLDHGIELVAGTFSRDLGRSQLAGAHFGLANDRIYSDYREMLRKEASQLDMVCIATPNDTHYPIARSALEAGLHVMSDKPATLTLSEALSLGETVKRCGRQYGLTYTYSGYPMVREARNLVAEERLGTIRKIVVEYPQGWLSQPLHNRQADWRLDPERAGPGGCIGDIGIHGLHLAEFVTRLQVQSLCADLGSVVPMRQLDDDCDILLRFNNGARGVLIASQISAGARNGLRLQVYGEKGGLTWRQEDPNALYLQFHDAPDEIRHAGSAYLSQDAKLAARLPPGHPEGYIEAFATLYRDFAAQIADGHTRVPGIKDGIRGMAFIETAVASNRARTWLDLKAHA